MKSFFIALIRNLFALFTALFIFIFFVFLFVGFIVAQFVEKPLDLKDKTILYFNLSNTITDSPKDELSGSMLRQLFDLDDSPDISILEIVQGLESAANDNKISGLVLKESLSSSSLPALREIRTAIDSFKKSGKPVIAYLENPTRGDMFLATVADHIILNPFSRVDMQGLASEIVFFGDAFKKYGVGFQTTKVGKYKSAVEIFNRSDMSEAEREQMNAIVQGMWSDIAETIAKSRTLSPSTLDLISEQEGVLHALDAKKYDLVDELGYNDNLMNMLRKTTDRQDPDQAVPMVSLARYSRSKDLTLSYSEASTLKPTVAVVYADGEIVDGSGRPGEVGSKRIARRLQKLRTDDSVKAVVLRVNSPGGSAYASEVIQRELMLLNSKKPLVVSFGNTAASGGYWISCYSRQIFADPMTLTGSIGVFAMLFNINDIANNYGVTFDGVQTSPFANIGSMYQPKTPEQLERLQYLADFTYSAFLYKVADGRGISVEQARDAAEGRVWLAQDAKEYGLIDQFGGITDAINYAAELSGVGKDYQLVQMPHRGEYAETLLDALQSNTESPLVLWRNARLWKALQDDVKFLSSFNDPQDLYARLPYQLRFW